ncbi:MAG: hypothetical protein R6V19_11620, partial [Armatimonadota bacterium]
TSLSVTVDGQPDNLEDRNLKGDTITVVKESQIGDMDHTAETTFEGDTITQKHSFTLRDDIDFVHFYPFIYSVTPETTEWLGKTLAGEELSDIFDTSKNYEFNRDALWAAQYDATSEKGILFFYPEPFTGQSSGTRIWDQPQYHKFFAEGFRGPAKQGSEYEYEMIMKFFSASNSEWKATARELASHLRGGEEVEVHKTERPRLYDAGVPETGQMTVQTDNYTIVFSADQAWTIYSYTYREHMIGESTGFYGTVLIPRGGNFIGTGHTEGGREIVHSVKLLVDGKKQPLQVGETVTGDVVQLIKTSTIHKFHAKTIVTVTNDEVIEHQDLTATEDMDLKLMYLFMHCWLNSTTTWMAETADGEIIDGEFSSDGGYEVNRDTRWVAEYEPNMGISILCYSPKIATGNGSRTHLWDHERYHKHYTRRIGGDGEEIAQGESMSYTMISTGVEEDGSWEKTRAAANMLKAQWPPVD